MTVSPAAIAVAAVAPVAAAAGASVTPSAVL